MNETYFFDTYAIMEILKGNSRYNTYKNLRPIITIFNLVELHYSIMRESDIELADELLEEYSIYEIDIDNSIIKKANEFKYFHRKKKLSIADAIGYTVALSLRIKFLTGDEQFKDMDNVEFVK